MQRVLLVIVFFFAISLVQAQSAAINTDGSNADASAILDVKSTNKGMLVPRMTTAQRTAIASPAKGLLVFDNDTGDFWFYNGTAWTSLSSGSPINYWTQNGNNIRNNNNGNVGIGTSTPVARLTVDSSIMVDETNSNQGTLERSSLYFGSDKRVGIVRSFLTGSSGRNGLGFFTNNTRRLTIDSTGQVGIGTVNPVQTLHVNGMSYFAGNIGIGSLAPNYAFENRWGSNFMQYNLGIGTVPTTTYALDVDGGPSRFRTDTRIDGVLNPNNTLNIGSNTMVDGTLAVSNNATVEGSLTVNNGKGVAYNANSGSNLRIHQFTTATFNAVLAGHAISAEGEIIFNGGVTSNPRVFVGDIDVTGGSAGQLYMVQLQLYGCTTSGGVTTCKARLINNSANSVNYSITWNCIAIGN